MKRILYHIRAPEPGPTLVGVGGLHGNEPAGVKALQAVGASLARGGAERGEFVAVTGNTGALARGVRYLDRDLNRIWSGGSEAGAEARERDELVRVLGEVRDRARGPVFVLDLHTTSGEAPPFTAVRDRPSDLVLAGHLPVPMVLGLVEALQGTMVLALARAGVPGLAFEAGNHDDRGSEQRAADALWLLLGAHGIVSAERRRTLEARERLAAAARGYPRALKVVHTHPVSEDHDFRMRPGFRSFQEVREGEPLADDRRGEIRAPSSGRVVMPLYQPRGSEGFFLGRPVTPAGLRPPSTRPGRAWTARRS